MNEDEVRSQLRHLAALRKEYERRLQALEKRLALLGVSADVSLELEIENIRNDLIACDQNISKKQQLLLGPKYEALRDLNQAIRMLEDADATIDDIRELLINSILFTGSGFNGPINVRMLFLKRVIDMIDIYKIHHGWFFLINRKKTIRLLQTRLEFLNENIQKNEAFLQSLELTSVAFPNESA